MSDFGIKVSVDNINVQIASASNLVYSSKYSNFKIHSILTQAVNVSSGMQDVTVAVDNPIDYPPLFFAYAQDSHEVGTWYMAHSWGGILSAGGTTVSTLVYYDSATNQFKLNVLTYGGWTGGTLTFKIIVFADIVDGVATDIAAISNSGIKVALENKDVTSVDADMSMTSKYRNLTIFDTDTAETTAAGGNTVTVPHNLGYVPIVTGFMKRPGTSEYIKVPAVYDSEPGVSGLGFFKVTANDLIIKDYGYLPGNPNILYRYLIFNEQLA